VIIDVDLAVFECSHLVRKCWQGFEDGAIQQLKPFLAAAVFLLERATIQVFQQGTNSLIEFNQTEEALMSQASQYPALDDLHTDLRQGLILGVTRTCGQDHRAIVTGTVLCRAIDDRLISVSVSNQRLRAVRHDHFRNKFNDNIIEDDKQIWLKFFKDGESLDDKALPAWMKSNEMRQAMSTLKQFSEKEQNYHAYQARQNFLREQRTIQWEYEQDLELERQQKEAAMHREVAAVQEKDAALHRESIALQEIERLKALIGTQ
jgi:hypothetical protein